MAVAATQADLPETPEVLFFMARRAGCGKVRPPQREFPCVVLVDGETGLVESLCGMTIRAVLHDPLAAELTPVVIGMTIGAEAEFQGIGQVGLVAA